MRSTLTIFVWPMRAHSARIWRTVAFVATSVTRPSRIDSCTSAEAVEAARSVKRALAAMVFAESIGIPASIRVRGLFVPKILDDLSEDVVQRIPGPVRDKPFYFCEIGHAPRHVLEAGFVRFVVGNELDRRIGPRELAHALGERPDAHLLRIADVDHLSDSLGL